MISQGRWIWLLAVGIIMLAASCAREAGGPGTAGRLTLTGAGATFPYPLYSKWFDEYSKIEPGVRVNYQSIGSGGGIQQLKAGTVDFGASDAPLSDEEEAAMPGAVVHIPTVAGAVAITYNLPGMSETLRLSPEAIAGIYLGEIKRWRSRQIAAINPDARLPDLPIAVSHRSDGSGTTYIFTHYLSAVSKPWADRVGAGKSVAWPVGIGGKGNEGVTGVVKQTPGSIGYVELAYAVQNGLSYALVRNSAGEFVEPTVASTTAAAAAAAPTMARDVRVSIVNAAAPDAYPIAGFTYILVHRDHRDRARGEALATLLDWAIHDGQRFAEPLLYAPLPGEIVAINETALAGLRPREPAAN
ncbi:MAG: phosphate ABC transporter substrate-binding protein PstS [Armatimonadota bacterium]|nr:MAG: phosphate ABC transporter substrate-binding protein PstS [Armatimonadota bacterium]